MVVKLRDMIQRTMAQTLRHEISSTGTHDFTIRALISLILLLLTVCIMTHNRSAWTFWFSPYKFVNNGESFILWYFCKNFICHRRTFIKWLFIFFKSRHYYGEVCEYIYIFIYLRVYSVTWIDYAFRWLCCSIIGYAVKSFKVYIFYMNCAMKNKTQV